ncbi:MAG: translocation/assembly module TamB domain-containing protein [Bacteroidia bacterium]
MPKIVKIPLLVIAILLGLALILWGVLQTTWFQNKLKNLLLSQLEEQLGTTVSIDEVEIQYFDKFEASGIYLEDERGDSLFYIASIKADYDLWSWNKEKVHFDKLIIDQPKVFFKIREGESAMNLQFLIDHFQQTDTSSSSAMVISVDELVLQEGYFQLQNFNREAPKDRSFNENNLRFYHINGTLKEFELINDSLNFVTNDLNTIEHCGFEIQQLSANCIISSSVMDYSNLSLKTNRSHIKDYVRFNYNSYKDFSSFVTDIRISSKLNQSSIHTKDLEYFSNELSVYDELIELDGQVSGTVARIRAKKLKAKFGELASFDGNVKITGIPDMSNTFWDLDVNSFNTKTNSLAQILQISDISSELQALRALEFSGQFTGFLKEFVSYGTISTALGNAKTDIKFGIDPNGLEAYTGSISTQGFNLGPLIGNEQLGKAAFALNIDGKGLELEKLDANINGKVHQLNFADYNYQNISLDGDFKFELFQGSVQIDDPNLVMDFSGLLDLNKELARSQATTNISYANLYELGLDKKQSSISLNGEMDLHGTDMDNLGGTMVLDKLVWTGVNEVYPIENISLNINPETKELELNSSLVDLKLEGEYEFSELPDLFTGMLSSLYPSDAEVESNESNNMVDLDLKIKEYHPLIEQYVSGVKFDEASLNLTMNAEEGSVKLTSEFENVSSSSIGSESLQFTLNKLNYKDDASYTMSAEQFQLGDTVLFYFINAKGEVEDDKINIQLEAQRDINLNAHIDAYIKASNDSISLFFNKVDALINEKLWQMGTTDFANIVYHEGLTELFYFDFRNKKEIIFFDGAFGNNTNKINFVFDQFLLSNANPFLSAFNMSVGGVANGYVDLTYREGFPIFESDFVLDQLSLDGDTLGDFILVSQTADHPLKVKVDGRIEHGLFNGMAIGGDIDFNNTDDALNLLLTNQKSSVKPFEKYLSGLVSNMSGHSTANLHIGGPISQPKLSGYTKFSDLTFTVDYLQTTYKASALVEVGNDFFKINSAEIVDRFGHKGTAGGEIKHNNYSDFVFDLIIDNLDNFECLNTKRKDNELFYGTAFADGLMQIEGPMEEILLTIRAKSRKGTKINIPLDNLETDGQLSYIQFVDLTADNEEIKELVTTNEGVLMDFNFEITNDADVELIFDELLGDKIKGNGHGNLRMEINTYGEFNMYGDLVIDKGDYLFTALNFINKYFTVEPGSTLKWDGDPYNATVDLTASKREYPLASSLMTGLVDAEELKDYRTTVPVDCELKLSGLLFNPNIEFGLSFPNQNEISGVDITAFNTIIQRVKQDKEELDRQVFALIVLGSFIPTAFSGASLLSGNDPNNTTTTANPLTSSVNNSLSDFVSSQLSNWLSQIDPKWQVGIDYQISNDAQARDELILSLRRKFLNDRLELQGSYDATATTGARPYDLNVQYDLSKDGSFKVRGFQKNANDPTLGNLYNITTSGVGFYYRHQFDHFWFSKDKKDSTSTNP